MRRDFLALLMLLILVAGFVAYEMAGETLRGWHTITDFSARYPILMWAIIGGFVVAGFCGAIWFYFHTKRYKSRHYPK